MKLDEEKCSIVVTCEFKIFCMHHHACMYLDGKARKLAVTIACDQRLYELLCMEK